MAEGLRKEINQILRELRKSGEFDVRLMKNGHWRVERKDGKGRPVTLASSPGSWRGVRNGIAQLRQHVGFVRPTEKNKPKLQKTLDI